MIAKLHLAGSFVALVAGVSVEFGVGVGLIAGGAIGGVGHLVSWLHEDVD